jgi:hypothetical protein
MHAITIKGRDSNSRAALLYGSRRTGAALKADHAQRATVKEEEHHLTGGLGGKDESSDRL